MTNLNIPKYEHPIFKYSELAYKRRGLILNQTIDLESAISRYISIFYVRDLYTMEELTQLFLNHITFNKKIVIVKEIITTKDENFLKTHPTIFKDLDKIRKVRNEMAHTILYVKDTFVGNRHKLKQGITKLGNKQIEFDEKRITELSEMINKYFTVFYYWNNIIPPPKK